jgi:hypothetical protein
MPLSIAAKPHFLSHLLDRGFTAALFLDPDILVARPLGPLVDATVAHAVVLTPHLLGYLEGSDAIPREVNILQCGIYNGGCVGVSARASARQFLTWWQDRVQTHCRHDIPEGMHYDQRWLDLVPALFDDVRVVRDADCNVAHWNLPERDVDSSCRFFHFSGFEPEEPSAVTKYSRRLTVDALGPVAALFERYMRLLDSEGYRVTRNWPYAFDSFDNGVAIPDLARQMYQSLDSGAVAAFGDPFQVNGRHSYFQWLSEPAERRGGPRHAVTRLWESVYRSRPDLRLAFPDVFGADHRAFQSWIITSGLREHRIPKAFVPLRSQEPLS